MVSLREIADRVGCTRATVSYALRSHPNISAETRCKVRKVAHELGWRPDARLTRHMALVRAADSDRSQPNLAIVINKTQQELATEHTPRLHLEGARTRAEELGYHADVFNLAEDPLSATRLGAVLRARGVEGVVYIATLDHMLSLAHAKTGRAFATAVVGIRYPKVPYHVAINDLSATAHSAVAQVVGKGFRRPGAILPRAFDRMLSWEFSAGIHAGQLDLRPSDRVPVLLTDNGVRFSEKCLPAIKEWMQREKPDAILTTHPGQLVELARRTGSAILSLPLFSLDLHPSQPVCGGVDQLSRQVGAAGVDLAVAQLHRDEKGIPKFQLTMQVEGEWKDLPATGTANARPDAPAAVAVASKSASRTRPRRK